MHIHAAIDKNNLFIKLFLYCISEIRCLPTTKNKIEIKQKYIYNSSSHKKAAS